MQEIILEILDEGIVEQGLLKGTHEHECQEQQQDQSNPVFPVLLHSAFLLRFEKNLTQVTQSIKVKP